MEAYTALKGKMQKLREAFLQLLVIILADSLYASEPLMDICKDDNNDNNLTRGLDKSQFTM